jgi:hypothetical protein
MADQRRRPKKTPPRPALPRSARLSEALISQATPSFNAWHIAEPRLIFAGSQACEDPKTGLTLYGPAALNSGPRNAIRLGVIGSGETIQALKNWIRRAEKTIAPGLNSRGKPYDPMIAPDFPGFSNDSPFQCDVQIDDRLCVTLTQSEIDRCLTGSDFRARTENMVSLVSERLCVLADKDPQPDVVACAMPHDVEVACGPGARDNRLMQRFLTPAAKGERKIRRNAQKTGQMLLNLFDVPSEISGDATPHAFRDFHDALKAHAMRAKLPTQLIWESTLKGARDNQDPATTAWNFFTALYYKAGNMPWELNFSVPRTCFIGITFYRESPDPDAPTRICLAQAFSESGEGLVLRGERVTWDKDRDRKPHLTSTDAETITRRVLDLYQTHFNGPPHRVVIHKTSRYWPEELAGFRAAIGGIHSYDFLALERRGIRFLRLGKEPPIRGTVIELGRRDYLVYTRGCIPFLRSYPGMRIPNPLEVVEHHGDSSAEKVCAEILALTKLNWNTCAFASADPVTIAFSRNVATIIKELPNDIEPLTKYRFYM